MVGIIRHPRNSHHQHKVSMVETANIGFVSSPYPIQTGHSLMRWDDATFILLTHTPLESSGYLNEYTYMFN